MNHNKKSPNRNEVRDSNPEEHGVVVSYSIMRARTHDLPEEIYAPAYTTKIYFDGVEVPSSNQSIMYGIYGPGYLIGTVSTDRLDAERVRITDKVYATYSKSDKLVVIVDGNESLGYVIEIGKTYSVVSTPTGKEQLRTPIEHHLDTIVCCLGRPELCGKIDNAFEQRSWDPVFPSLEMITKHHTPLFDLIAVRHKTKTGSEIRFIYNGESVAPTPHGLREAIDHIERALKEYSNGREIEYET